MKKFFVFLVFSLSSYIGFGQLPGVDTVTFGRYGGSSYSGASYEIKNKDLYWSLTCQPGHDTLDIHFDEGIGYRVISSVSAEENNINIITDRLDELLLVANWSSNKYALEIEILDTLNKVMFTVFVDYTFPRKITSFGLDNPMTGAPFGISDEKFQVCSVFGGTELRSQTEYFSVPLNEDPNVRFGHYEDGNWNYFEELGDINFSEEDSIKFMRISGETIINHCHYDQKEGELYPPKWGGVFEVVKGENKLMNGIKVREGFSSNICPGETTEIELIENPDTVFNHCEWYNINTKESVMGGAKSFTWINKPGTYFYSEDIRGLGESCPMISNSIEITTSTNCKGVIKGIVLDNHENRFEGVKVRASNGQVEISQKNGSFEFHFDQGDLITKIEIADTNYHYVSQEFNLNPAFPFFEDCALWTYRIYENDLGVSLNSGRNRPGFTIPYTISLENRSKNDQTSNVVVSLDKALTYTSVEDENTPEAVAGQTLTWNNISVASGETKRLKVYAVLDRRTSREATLKSVVSLDLTDDVLANNSDTLFSAVTGSYDPNDKLVSFNGYASHGYVSDSTEFEYTIRFQNTGNDTAFTVRIEDVIDTDFDLSTISVIDASHAYQMEIDNDTVNWIFNNILLVDSTTNEPASHGFVRFKINQKEGNVDGTMLTNQAGIFFDYNDPIITNETVNVIGEYVPGMEIPKQEEPEEEDEKEQENEVVDGLEDLQLQNIAIFPNPTTSYIKVNVQGDLTIYNVRGTVQYHGRIFEDQKMNVSTWGQGVYYYELSTSKGLKQGSFVKE